MTQHDDRVRLRHMLDHAREAVGVLRGRSRADLDTDRILGLAIVRLLEIVGEAAARASEETRTSLAGVPWREIVGLRNRIIHGYDDVDYDIVWETVASDLPALIAALERSVEPAGPFE
ncbi:MAG: DUF86 domain-containing protein [Rhodocyclaceae bacterium]|jgi:uncharacterized protein with HEPN domain|nr:DUF86 domain-containing protein [Rhodocyclaceae bacterium]